MHKCPLGIHQIELVIETGPGFSNSCSVRQHAHCTLDSGQITTRDDSRWLVVDADLESGRAPVNKLDSALGLDGGDGGVNVFGYDIPAEQQTAGHVLT